MPYAAPAFNNQDPNDPNKKNGQDPTNISGGGGASFSTGLPGQESSGAKDRKSSGQYANIQSYLSANKDQGDQMGQKIASDVDQSAGAAQQQIGALDSKAPKVEAYDPNDVYNNVTNLSDEQKSTYRDQRATGGYTGPQSIDQVQGYADTQKATQDAAARVKNTGSEAGQQQLLKDTYGRPQYSAGENRLDQVLLQNSAGSKQALENVNKKYSGLENLFNSASTNVGNSINQANQQSLANKQNIMTAEQQQYDNLLNPIQARADQMNQENPLLAARMQDDLSDYTLSEETLQKLGLSEGANVYDQDLSKYFKANNAAVGLNNAASADERAKYQALSDLIQDPSRNQLDMNGKAVDPFAFDRAAFDKDNAAKASEYENFRNTDTGRFYDWAGQEQLKGNNLLTDNYGQAQQIGSGSFFDSINGRTLAQLESEKDSLIRDHSGSGVFSSAYEKALPQYIQWMRDQYSADNKIKKG